MLYKAGAWGGVMVQHRRSLFASTENSQCDALMILNGSVLVFNYSDEQSYKIPGIELKEICSKTHKSTCAANMKSQSADFSSCHSPKFPEMLASTWSQWLGLLEGGCLNKWCRWCHQNDLSVAEITLFNILKTCSQKTASISLKMCVYQAVKHLR